MDIEILNRIAESVPGTYHSDIMTYDDDLACAAVPE